MNKGIDDSLSLPLSGMPGCPGTPVWMTVLGLLPEAISPSSAPNNQKPTPKPLSRGSLPLFKTLLDRDTEVATLRRAETQQVLWANTALQSQWGLSLAGAGSEGLDWLDLLHPQDRVRVQAEYQSLQAPTCYDLSYRLRLPTGDVRLCREQGCLALSEEGEMQILSRTEDMGSVGHAQASPAFMAEAANDARVPLQEPSAPQTSTAALAGSPIPLLLRDDLRGALRRGELRLFYQPQIDLRSGQVASMEALLRWVRCDGSLILPTQFIGLAEQSGLINELGEWVLQEAGQQWRSWQAAGKAQRRIAVNVSALQLASPRFMPALLDAMPEAEINAGALQIEITESCLMGQASEELHNLARLNEMGVPLALDDFGTGYANFAMLKRLPLDCLKIDQSLVADLPGERPDRSIVSAIIAMAHQLHLRVVAEGVETPAQCRCLQALHCDEVQGFLFTRPVSAEAVQTLMGDWQGASATSILVKALSPEHEHSGWSPSPMMAAYSEATRCSALKT